MERRVSPRIRVTLPAELQFRTSTDLTPYKATVCNLSQTGASLSFDTPQADFKEQVALSFPLEKNLRCRLQAQVVWKNLYEDRVKTVGLSFIPDTADELILQQLHSFIEDRLPAHISEIRRITSIRRPGFRLSDREFINLSILNVLRRKSPTSKSYIAQQTGCNIVTVTNYLKNYIKKGLVTEKGFDVSSGGRRPELLEFNADYGYVAAFNFNQAAEQGLCVVSDFANKPLHKRAFRFYANAITPKSLADAVEENLSSTGVDRSKIFALGLGFDDLPPGADDLVHSLEERFGLAVYIENSYAANLFFEAANRFDDAHTKKVLFFGVQNSLALLYGEDMFLQSGTIGLPPRESLDHTAQFYWMDKDTSLESAAVPLRLADPARMSEKIAVKIAYLANIFTPDLIVLGGGIEKFNPALIEQITRQVKHWCFDAVALRLQICVSALGAEAVCLGLGSIITRDIFATM